MITPARPATVPLVSQATEGAPSHLNQPPPGAGGASPGSPHTRRRSRAGRRPTPPHRCPRSGDCPRCQSRCPRKGARGQGSRGRRSASGKRRDGLGLREAQVCAHWVWDGDHRQGPMCKGAPESGPGDEQRGAGAVIRGHLNPGPPPWTSCWGGPLVPWGLGGEVAGQEGGLTTKVKRLGDRAR